jgi:hypothetical protein
MIKEILPLTPAYSTGSGVPRGVAALTRRRRFVPDSAPEGTGFELLVPQINSPGLAPDTTAGISLMFVFDAHLASTQRATVLLLQGSHTPSGKAGQLQT